MHCQKIFLFCIYISKPSKPPNICYNESDLVGVKLSSANYWNFLILLKITQVHLYRYTYKQYKNNNISVIHRDITSTFQRIWPPGTSSNLLHNSRGNKINCTVYISIRFPPSWCTSRWGRGWANTQTMYDRPALGK